MGAKEARSGGEKEVRVAQVRSHAIQQLAEHHQLGEDLLWIKVPIYLGEGQRKQ